MASALWHTRQAARKLLDAEQGTIYRDAPHRVALLYPSPYRAAMSSLGYQTIYRQLNGEPGVAADRATLPDDVAGYRARGIPLFTLERAIPVGNYPILAFSVAYELEIAGLIDCLDLAGVPALAAQRTWDHPLVIAGGPLTFSNPSPLAPFCDLLLLGEAEQTLLDLIREAVALGFERRALRALIDRFAGRSGFYVPEHDRGQVPPIAAADDSLLPARSQIITPNTELRSMYLTEAARGCSRGCTYCVMRRSTNGGMRVIEPDRIVELIPAEARRVGLVGAAVTDHPRINEIVRRVLERGCEVGISSLRADKLTDELVGLLSAGGYRTLTVAADGASQRMRRLIERRTDESHLVRSAELAKKHGMHTLKLYLMVGVPGETDRDIDELILFARELVRIHPRIAIGVAPFVAKRNTPLDGSEFAGIRVVDSRLDRLRRGLRGKVTVRPTSARWAWVEYMLAQSGPEAGLAVLDAHRKGGRFGDYKRAFAARGVEPTGPVARVPSTSELIALRRARRQAEPVKRARA
ncbi:MAG: B12-binding domain-containing radical SAM protein [Proteobacteria bacterium]|nr:B12-binding domain-containing radical SAM protein [Pseudomonadota bacterium]